MTSNEMLLLIKTGYTSRPTVNAAWKINDEAMTTKDAHHSNSP